MKNFWKNLYFTLMEYNKLYKPKELEIKNKYQKLRDELLKKEQEELEKVSDSINNEVNKDNLDLSVNPYTLYYKLGAEIGYEIRIEFDKNKEDDYSISKNFNSIENNFIFKYTMIDRREGVHQFCSKNYNGNISPEDILCYFKVIEVITGKTN